MNYLIVQLIYRQNEESKRKICTKRFMEEALLLRSMKTLKELIIQRILMILNS